MTDKPPPLTSSLGFGIHPQPKARRGTRTAVGTKPGRRARILLVDRDAESRRLMTARLGASHYDVESVDSAEAALEASMRSRPDLVVSDLRLPGMDGLMLLRELKSRWASITVIIVTAHGTIPEAVRATQFGAFGFLVKPVDKAELLGQVKRAIQTSTFAKVEGEWRAKIVARSQLMEDRLELANRAANNDMPVLLTGENGTGKELLARAIHAASPRRDKPFAVLRCRGSREEAMDADLHAAIETAGGGTLLIDEISLLSARLQVELLERLGGGAAPVGRTLSSAGSEARLISTTSRNLSELMRTGDFRQDLFYHINVLPIEVPPLGRRREDIPLLVSHFLEQAVEPGGTRKIYSPEAIELLATSEWPGNVRQLFDLVKQNVALCHSNVMSKEFVERSLGGPPAKVPTYDEARDAFAREYLTNHLQAAAGNVTQAARLAKRSRTDFYKLLARYRVEHGGPRSDGGAPVGRKAPRKGRR
jgi:two-component system response regulator GlrR